MAQQWRLVAPKKGPGGRHVSTGGLKSNMVVRYMPNSGHGGPHVTPFMTIFVFYVSAQLPNIEKNEIYDVYKYQEV